MMILSWAIFPEDDVADWDILPSQLHLLAKRLPTLRRGSRRQWTLVRW